MLNLSNITLVGLTTRDYIGQRKSIQRCLDVAKFANVIVFTDNESEFPKDWTIIYIDRMTRYDYVAVHMLYTMPRYANLYADYILTIHWDSWIVDPTKWKSEFLDYDYIGAPWGDKKVGNDGFSIKSKKLLEVLTTLPIKPEIANCNPSDATICKDDIEICDGIQQRKKGFRSYLESVGIKYAPYELAKQFSTEGNYEGSFGIHGRHAISELYRIGLY